MTGATFKSNTFTVGTTSLSDGGKVVVEADAYIMVPAGKGIEMDPGAWTVTINSVIDSFDEALSFNDNFGSVDPAPLSKLTIGTEAVLISRAAASNALFIGVPVDITNAGLITGGAAGIAGDSFGPTSAKSFTITNAASGEISALTGIAIDTGTVPVTMNIKNAGSIIGTGGTGISWSAAANIVNSGYIEGSLEALNTASTLATTITNTSSIFGSVLTSNGDDTFKNSGLIKGDVNLYDGVNKVTNSGQILGGVILGSGADSLTNTAQITEDIFMFGGINTVTNSGIIEDDIFFGTGNDTVTNKGSILGDLLMDAGDNKVTNTGTIGGDLFFKSGNDVLSNTKIIGDDVDMGEGNNTLTTSGGIAGNVNFGAGNDTVTVAAKGTVVAMDLGDGNNKLTNSGAIDSLSGGTGADIVTNTGTIISIDLGGGDDTYTGGAKNDSVLDNTGNDTYKLGAGNDTVTLITGLDICDGGAGTDLVTLSALSDPSLINLDAKAVTLLGTNLQASSVVSAGASLSATIKNFEDAEGTVDDDVINGNAGANFIDGGDGADVLAGGLGKDTFNAGQDADTDIFVYFSTKDSGVTDATRDVILNFKGAGGAGGDVINFAAIDADSKTAGDQAFSFIGNNMPFTLGTMGQLRAVAAGLDTLIQADLNGDTKADFAITIVGTFDFIAGDFVL